MRMSDDGSRSQSLASWLLPAGVSGSLLVLSSSDSLIRIDEDWTGPILRNIDDLDQSVVGIVIGPGAQSSLPEDFEQKFAGLRFVLTLHPNLSPLQGDRSWGLLNTRKGKLCLIDPNDDLILKRFRPSLWKRDRFLPLSVLRRRITPLASLRVAGNACRTRMDVAVEVALGDMPHLEDNIAGSPSFQDKGKVTIPLLAGDRNFRFLKLALTSSTYADLENAHAVLDHIKPFIEASSVLAKIIPSTHGQIDIDGKSGWVETALPGRPLSQINDSKALPSLLEDTARIFRAIAQLPEDAVPFHDTTSRSNHLRALVSNADEQDMMTLDRILALLEQPHRMHLRKSDMSLSNILVESGAVSGLIDWDESGSTKWPAVHIADFALSWTWQRDNLARAQTVSMLLGDRPPALDSGLDIGHMLLLSGMSMRDFTYGVLESYLDHAHHELKHAIIGDRRERVSNLLLDPIRASAQFINSLERPYESSQ